ASFFRWASSGEIAGARAHGHFSWRRRIDDDADAVKGAVAVGRHVADRVAAPDLARDARARAQQIARRTRKKPLAAGHFGELLQHARIAIDVFEVEEADRVDGGVRVARALQQLVER